MKSEVLFIHRNIEICFFPEQVLFNVRNHEIEFLINGTGWCKNLRLFI